MDKETLDYGQELLHMINDFRQRIIAGTSDTDEFLTMTEIERLWSELRGNTSLLYSDMLSELLSKADETGLIRKKKENIEKKE